jgi:prevent-host-death family protein
MQTIGAFAAKTHFSAILEEVEKGERVTITKHGRPVARLVPITSRDDRDSVEKTIQRMKKFSQSHTLGGLDWKTLRDEGRR